MAIIATIIALAFDPVRWVLSAVGGYLSKTQLQATVYGMASGGLIVAMLNSMQVLGRSNSVVALHLLVSIAMTYACFRFAAFRRKKRDSAQPVQPVDTRQLDIALQLVQDENPRQAGAIIMQPDQPVHLRAALQKPLDIQDVKHENAIVVVPGKPANTGRDTLNAFEDAINALRKRNQLRLKA